MLYAKCQRPAQAEACFKLALPLLGKDLRSLAVVQQNLGAVYNCLGDYQMSLKHHESAAALYGQFVNLIECYLYAPITLSMIDTFI